MQNEQERSQEQNEKDRFQLLCDYWAATLRGLETFNAIVCEREMSQILHTATMVNFVGAPIDPARSPPQMPSPGPIPPPQSPPPQLPSPGRMTLAETEEAYLEFIAEETNDNDNGEPPQDGEPPLDDFSESY
jgi:hypothetical protein